MSTSDAIRSSLIESAQCLCSVSGSEPDGSPWEVMWCVDEELATLVESPVSVPETFVDETRTCARRPSGEVESGEDGIGEKWLLFVEEVSDSSPDPRRAEIGAWVAPGATQRTLSPWNRRDASILKEQNCRHREDRS